MWPFKRKQNISNEAPDMPPELNQYYQAEKRQQTVVTWLLGFATLAITIAVAFLLFLAARWVVQKVRKAPSPSPETSQQEAVENNNTPAPTNNNDAPAQTTPSQTQSGANTNNASGQGAQGTAPGSQTSSATNALPSTGPTETLAVFLIATAVGTFAYKRSIRQ